MVIDAYDTVTYGGSFGSGNPASDQTNRLEVVSRISETLNDVINEGRLPYARNPVEIRTSFLGTYVLRGKVVFAQMLALIEAPGQNWFPDDTRSL